MSPAARRNHTVRNILVVLLVLILVAGIGFHIFITKYLPPIVQKRLTEIVVNGSDSLYKLKMGKFNLSFWGGSAEFEDISITIDSNVYERMSKYKILPPLTADLKLKKAHMNGIGLRSLLFSHKIDIREIVFDSANVHLARHFKNSDENTDSTISNVPLWKLIQPKLKSIRIGNVYCADMRINYRNIDSAKAFHWNIEKSNILITDIRVDSLSASDSSRLLFAKNIFFNSQDIALKTPDGLYNMQIKNVSYTSAERSLAIKNFEFVPAVTEQQFIQYFGHQHEMYRLRIAELSLKNFMVSGWVTQNRFEAEELDLKSPVISISMNRNAPASTKSRKGRFPHQLLLKADFIINIRKAIVTGASMTYTEYNNVTNMTGKLNFPSLSGTIQNITNDPERIGNNAVCTADIRGSVMQTGTLHAIFRFDLSRTTGDFTLNSTINNLNAAQLQPLFKAMTAVDIQSMDLRKIGFSMAGNENSGAGDLTMMYDNMDILINKVGDDKAMDKKGFLSFLANRLAIYKSNPMDGEEIRKAEHIVIPRDMTRSFFNLVWKTLFNAAGEVVLRPLAKRKIDRRQERAEKKEARIERRQQRRNERKN